MIQITQSARGERAAGQPGKLRNLGIVNRRLEFPNDLPEQNILFGIMDQTVDR